MSSTVQSRQAAFTIQVDVAPRSTEQGCDDLRAVAQRVEQTLARLAPVILEAQEGQHQRSYEQLVQFFLGDYSPTPLDIVRAGMKANALRAVYSGSEWLTAAQIAQFAGLGSANPSGTVNRWKQRGKLFALQNKGQDFYPRYLLGDNFHPLAAAEEVLAVFVNQSPNRLANWFESRNGLLDGRRPRELLAGEPDRVVEAAQRTLDAELHAA